MAGLKDYQISVYVANLGKYAEGVLQGAWITLPMPCLLYTAVGHGWLAGWSAVEVERRAA